MTCARSILALLLAFAPAGWAVAESARPPAVQFGASSGPSAAFEPPGASAPSLPAQRAPSPPRKAPVALKPAPARTPSPSPITGSVVDRPARPLANVSVLHISLLPLQGDADKCGLDAAALQTAAIYPVAASARLKVGPGTLTHMHVRLSAVYVRRLEHCIVSADVRVSSLQQVELQHSKTALPLYVPLWEKTDIRLVPRAHAQKLAQERLAQISESLLVAWASQN